MTAIDIQDAHIKQSYPTLLAEQRQQHSEVIAEIQKLIDVLASVKKSVESASRVPLSVIFMGAFIWMRHSSLLSEIWFVTLAGILMFPFFGEGVRLALNRIPLANNVNNKKINTGYDNA